MTPFLLLPFLCGFFLFFVFLDVVVKLFCFPFIPCYNSLVLDFSSILYSSLLFCHSKYSKVSSSSISLWRFSISGCYREVVMFPFFPSFFHWLVLYSSSFLYSLLLLLYFRHINKPSFFSLYYLSISGCCRFSLSYSLVIYSSSFLYSLLLLLYSNYINVSTFFFLLNIFLCLDVVLKLWCFPFIPLFKFTRLLLSFKYIIVSSFSSPCHLSVFWTFWWSSARGASDFHSFNWLVLYSSPFRHSHRLSSFLILCSCAVCPFSRSYLNVRFTILFLSLIFRTFFIFHSFVFISFPFLISNFIL